MRVIDNHNHQGDICLIQISDCHLFASKDGELLGLNTFNSFMAALQQIHQQHQADLIVATGDLSQDETPQAYENFIEGLTHQPLPAVWLPGNHDIIDVIDPVFTPCAQIYPDKRFVMGGWQVILLDSTVSGVTYGRLSEIQLQFLRHSLEAHRDKSALVMLHHQALPVQSRWIDNIGLHNLDELLDVLDEFDNVKLVSSGHVHQYNHQIREGVEFITSPSTCVQFKPKQQQFCADTALPGYLEIILHPDGTTSHQVHRVQGVKITVDQNAQGY